MAEVERLVRTITVDGLVWGPGEDYFVCYWYSNQLISHSKFVIWFLLGKLVPVGYGIKKLQISCVVEDDKIGTDYLEEEITKFEDQVYMYHGYNNPLVYSL